MSVTESEPTHPRLAVGDGLMALAARMVGGQTLTYADLMLTPDDGLRYELIDGSLFVSPSPSRRHQFVAFELASILRDALGNDLAVITDADLLLDPVHERTALRPDVYVASRTAVRESRQHALAIEHCRLVIEVESPSSGRIDRVTKSGLFAEAGLQHYWRVEFSSDDWERSAVVTAYELMNGGYEQVARATAGQIFVVSVPVSVSFDPSVLTM